MKAVKQRGTGPELAVRALLSDLGVSYRVNNRKYPGSPDIVNRKRNWAIFVHGCFWHGHRSCVKTRGGRRGRIPRTNRTYWEKKISENRRRDARKERALREDGFMVLTIWECELREPDQLRRRLRDVLPTHD